MKFLSLKGARILTNRGILKIKAASPEILLGLGIVCGVAAVVTACIASRKVDGVIEEIKADLDDAETYLEEAKEHDDGEEINSCKRNVVKVWANGAWRIVKLYGPTMFLLVASGGSILASHGILKNRYLTTAAAYKALDESYKAYRAYVRDELGFGEGENAIAARAKGKNDIYVENEDGTLEKKDGQSLVQGLTKSPYEFDFNRYTAPTTWRAKPELNATFLHSQERYLTDLLHVQGHVFLNEALDAVGLERTTLGQRLGWFLGAGDDKVTFRFLEGYVTDYNTDSDLCKKNIRLNFNCDGFIDDMLRLKC